MTTTPHEAPRPDLPTTEVPAANRPVMRPAAGTPAAERPATGPAAPLADRPVTGPAAPVADRPIARPAVATPDADRPIARPAVATPDADRTAAVPPAAEAPTTRLDGRAARARFGKVRWGSAFFGWLAATGTAVLLGAIVTLVAAATGTTFTPGSIDLVTAPAPGTGLVAGVIALAVVFVAYYCGGYVAGRMARFGGARQGLAVWLWSIVGSVVVGLVGLVVGDRIGSAYGLPRLVVDPSGWTLAGIVAVAAALVVALVGAMLGGLGGMVFHRRLDRAAARHNA